MSVRPTILLVEVEALILMDLEFAAEDAGFDYLSAAYVAQALEHVEHSGDRIDVAVLDLSLAAGENSLPVAEALSQRGIPFVIHSGTLDYNQQMLTSLNAPQLAKPAASTHVIATAQSLLAGNSVRSAVAR